MTDEEKFRRPRGWLMSDMESALLTYQQGLAPGEFYDTTKPMTPSLAARLLVEVEELDEDDKPSTGAIHNIFKKWEECGYATFRAKPYAFVEFAQPGERSFDEVWAEYKAGGPSVEELRAQLAEAERAAEAAEAELAAFDAE
jgi:hypothetical protein